MDRYCVEETQRQWQKYHQSSGFGCVKFGAMDYAAQSTANKRVGGSIKVIMRNHCGSLKL